MAKNNIPFTSDGMSETDNQQHAEAQGLLVIPFPCAMEETEVDLRDSFHSCQYTPSEVQIWFYWSSWKHWIEKHKIQSLR